MSGGGEKRAHADQGERARIDERWPGEMLRSVAEEKTEARADKECGSENAADGAGAKRRRGRENFQNENHGERLPEPLAVEDGVDGAVTVSANFGMKDGDDANDQSADDTF